MYCFLEGLQLYNGLGAAAFLPWPLVLDEPEGQNPEVKKHTDLLEKALTGTFFRPLEKAKAIWKKAKAKKKQICKTSNPQR